MRRNGYVFLAFVVVLATGCVDRGAQDQAKRTSVMLDDKTPRIQVLPAIQRSISEELQINGQVATSDDSTVGAKVGGRLIAVYVKDGDAVSAGQIIAVQDSSQLSAQVRQAMGQVSAMQAQLSQALTNARVNPARSTSAIKSAEAGLRSAKAQLEKAKRGARSEELKQSEIQVQSARSNMETAKKERDRQFALYKEGATSQQRYEQAENAYQQALGGYESALEMLNIRRSQTQPEDIRSAEETVRQAEEALRNAKANKELDQTWNQQVTAARAQVMTAQAGLDLARQNMADATIRSPFSGRISGRPAQPGTVLSPGSPIARLIGQDGVYFEGQIPESKVASVLPGRGAEVTFDALPGQSFSGTVAAINPLGDSVGRLFLVRITLAEATEQVKPGMFARGNISLRTISDAVLVPLDSILSDTEGDYLFILSGKKAVKRKIKKGIEKGDMIQVTNVSANESVIVKGHHKLKDGIEVKIENGDAKKGGA